MLLFSAVLWCALLCNVSCQETSTFCQCVTPAENDVNLTLGGYDSDATERQVAPVATVQCEGKNTGFFFHNITNLSITGLKVQDCGFNRRGKYTFMGAILMEWILNLYMSGVVIYNASGMGLHGYEVIGNSTICDAIIDSSHSVMGFLSQNLYAIVLCETE